MRFMLKEYFYVMLREEISLEEAKENLLELIDEVIVEIMEEKESE